MATVRCRRSRRRRPSWRRWPRPCLRCGGECVQGPVLRSLFLAIGDALAAELDRTGLALQPWLRANAPAWNVVGRVHFHLAENRRDPEHPFAFLATYTTGLSAHAQAQHRRLGQAVQESAESGDRSGLLALLLPVHRAAERCDWLRAVVESGEIYHPLRWSVANAVAFLRDVSELEAAGVVVRVPAVWRGGRPPRPRVVATVGSGAPAGVGVGALLDFSVDATLDGEPLTAEEWAALLHSTEGLALLRGQWVEVDRESLGALMERFRAVGEAAAGRGLTFAEAMRLVAGADGPAEADDAPDAVVWSGVQAGPWLAEVLAELRAPGGGRTGVAPGPELRATLRPYQRDGVSWLYLLARLGRGGCLADDMGLGKTLQVIALMLLLRRDGATGRHLLVVPASLIANWSAELARFAPDLRVFVAHPSATPSKVLASEEPPDLGDADVVITSYGTATRMPWARVASWHLLVLDEAQAVKNPAALQTRAVKAFRATCRIALTGTPIENRLSDLFSLFDVVAPGLLGTQADFRRLADRLAERAHDAYRPLRELCRPYILRRMKTDPTVIADLPDKTEVKAWCPLTRVQAVLYQQAVDDLAERLADAEGMARRGLVLASLLRLKQICNHPSHWLGDGVWAPADSGKLGRLRQIAETVAERQDKVLVFTQFRQVIEPLAAYLSGIFGRDGLTLHGGTPVRQRKARVDAFQDDEDIPFMVLSLKAGGTGLNLTAAAHVVHFDRWWNPAVENQATDRAFRIGQTRNVMVHKLICRGTVEERIDALIESKAALAADLLQGGAEATLTEMSDEELLHMVTCDIQSALEDAP